MVDEFFFFQAEDGIRDAQESRGLGDVYKEQQFVHDHLVGSDGAFNETVKGLINAGNSGINIELELFRHLFPIHI